VRALSLVSQFTEWLLKRSQVNILEITATQLRWFSGSFIDNRFILKAHKKIFSEEPYFNSTTATINSAKLTADLREISGYRFPFEQHVSIVLADSAFTFGSFQIPAMAVKSGFLPFLEREIHKSTTLNYRDFSVRYESGEKRDNKVPVQYCALNRSILDQLKLACDQAGIVPLSVQPAFAGHLRMLKSVAAETRHPSIFLDFGHESVTAGIFSREGLRAVHVINIGLNAMVRAVQDARQCGFAEAMRLVTEEIVLLEDPNSDAQSEIEIYRHMEAVFIDLLQKIYGFLLLFSNDHPDESGFVKIIVSGEGTRIKNLDKLISANLGIPATGMQNEIELLIASLVLPAGETPATLATVLGNLLLTPWQLERFDRIMAA